MQNLIYLLKDLKVNEHEPKIVLPTDEYKDLTINFVPESESRDVVPRDFKEDEIREINTYITTNVPYSILANTLPITDNPLHKARVYKIAYRFLNSCKNYVSDVKTRDKLQRVLDKNRELWSEVSRLLLDMDENKTSFTTSIKYAQLLQIYKDDVKDIMIDDFIDFFLVFAEKQNLIHIDTITGLNLETPEGRDAYNKLMQDDI